MKRTRISREFGRLTPVVRVLLGMAIVASLVFVAPLTPARAAAGDLDTTFGLSSSGANYLDIGALANRATAVAIQTDNKLVVAGTSDTGIVVARYTTAGSLDTTTFGSGSGYTTATFGASSTASDVAVKTDGSILVAGTATYGVTESLFLAQFTSAGVLDATFGSSGVFTQTLLMSNTVANALAVQDDGMIVVGGSVNNDMFLARFTSSGSPDTGGFNNPFGYATADFTGSNDEGHAVAIQSDGKFIIAGFTDNGTSDDFAMARFDTTGAIDTTFGGGDGKVSTNFSGTSTDQAFDAAIQPDGYIVLAGLSNQSGTDDFAVARYTDSGAADSTFNTDGWDTVDFHADQDQAFGVAIQPTGRIVLAGFANEAVTTNHDVAVVRYTITGTLDTTFNTDGIVTTDFGPPLTMGDIGSEDYANDVLIQPDNKIVVVGYSDYPLSTGDDNVTILRYEAPNTIPTLSTIAKNVDEDNDLTFSLTDFSGAFSDTDGDPLIQVQVKTLPSNGTLKLSSVNVTAGQVIARTDLGNLTYTPNTDYSGGDSFTWNASDGLNYAAADANANITVNAVNDAPILDPVGNKSGNEGSAIGFTATASDVDSGDILTFTLDSGAPAGAAISTSGVFAWTPSEAQGPGVYPVTVRVTDSGTPALDDFENISITVGEVNSAPTLAAIGPLAASEGVLFTTNASASDPDLPANTFTYTLDAGYPSGASINSSSGQITWTPSEAQGPGTYNFTVRVADSGTPSLEDTEVFSVTVNEVNSAPVLNPIGDQSGDEGTEISFTATATDTDVPANSLSFSLDAGYPAGAGITTGGLFTWTPVEADGPGDYQVTVRVTDNGAIPLSDTETITITVDEANIGPTLDPIGDKSVNEGSTVAFSATATDGDTPPNNLTFSLGPNPPSGASITSGGDFSFPTDETMGGSAYTVTIQVTDDGVPNLSDSETITITVVDTNLPPVLDPIGDKSVDEENLLSFTVSAADVDVPADSLTYYLVNAPAGAALGEFDGAFTWTPTEAQGPGDYSFSIWVFDNANPTLFDLETITVTVAEINTAPVIDPIADINHDEGTLLEFTVGVTDPDLPANNLTYSFVGSPPSGASIDANGVFSWTPSEAQGPGSYPITVRVTDGGTPDLSDTESFMITVADINNAPVLDAIADPSVDEGSLLSFTATATDSDTASNLLTFSLVGSPPAGSQIDSATGEFTWTPSEDQGPGSYIVTVRVQDDNTPPGEDTQDITITVNEVNQAPVLDAIGDQLVGLSNTLTFTATATDNDNPANNLTFSLDAGAPAGAGIDPVTGVFTWTPSDAALIGPHAITVRVTDNGTPALDDMETFQVTVFYPDRQIYLPIVMR